MKYNSKATPIVAIEATEAVTTGARGKGAVGSVSATVKVIVSEEAKFPIVSLAKTVRLCDQQAIPSKSHFQLW